MAPKFDAVREQRIIDALHEQRLNPKLKISVLARKYDVAASTLRHRQLGRPPLSSKGGQNKALNQNQDERLLSYIKSLGQHPPCRIAIRAAANDILLADGSMHQVGRDWATRWLVRHKDDLAIEDRNPRASGDSTTGPTAIMDSDADADAPSSPNPAPQAPPPPLPPAVPLHSQTAGFQQIAQSHRNLAAQMERLANTPAVDGGAVVILAAIDALNARVTQGFADMNARVTRELADMNARVTRELADMNSRLEDL